MEFTAFEEATIQSAMHVEMGEYQQAQSVIDEAYKYAVLAGEVTNELKLDYDLWTAMIYEKRCDWEAALAIYLSLKLDNDHTEYTLNKLRIADMHVKQDNIAIALECLVSILNENVFDVLGDGMFLLKVYSGILVKHPFDDRFNSIINKIVELLDIDHFVADVSSSSQALATIESLWSTEQNGAKRYAELYQIISLKQDDDNSDELIDEYVKNESVGYYRNKMRSFKAS